MTTLRTGTNSQYSANWSAAFGEKKNAAAKSKTQKKSTAKVAKKMSTKKKTAKK